MFHAGCILTLDISSLNHLSCNPTKLMALFLLLKACFAFGPFVNMKVNVQMRDMKKPLIKLL